MLQPPGLVKRQPAIVPSPAAVGLFRDALCLAPHCNPLPLTDQHLSLAQHRDNLLCRKPLPCHFFSPPKKGLEIAGSAQSTSDRFRGVQAGRVWFGGPERREFQPFVRCFERLEHGFASLWDRELIVTRMWTARAQLVRSTSGPLQPNQQSWERRIGELPHS